MSGLRVSFGSADEELGGRRRKKQPSRKRAWEKQPAACKRKLNLTTLLLNLGQKSLSSENQLQKPKKITIAVVLFFFTKSCSPA